MRLLLLGAVLVFLAAMPATLRSPGTASASFSGDFNCDTTVNVQDVIAVLSVAGGVQTLSSCANAVSVDCDGDVDVTDALLLLHFLSASPVSLPAGCSQINSLIPGTSPQDAADQLSARIVGGTGLMDVVDAVQESLARGGVSTGDANGTTYTAAFAPAASNVAIPMEVLNLALEARNAQTTYRMDAAQVGQMLSDFGWPFVATPTPGAQLVAMLKELVTGAQALPNDPNSFTPLFLEDMGKLQDPSVDLAAGDAAPEDVHFTMLGLQLLVAIYDRQAVLPSPQSDLAHPADNDPCSGAKKVLSGVLGPFAGQVDGILVNESGPHFITQALEHAGVEGAEAIGQALEALAVAAKLWKFVDFFSSVQVNVTLDGDNHVHKPLDTDPDLLKLFKATAGISEEDAKAYEEANTGAGSEINQAVRDCMNTFGVKMFSDLGDLARDSEHWKVDWTISNNLDNQRHEKAITWSPDQQDKPGAPHLANWRSNMVQQSEFSSETDFIVQVGTELQSDHVHPVVKTDDVRVCGSVFAAEPPDLQTLVDAAKGGIGLITAIAELGGGWLQTIDGPQACRTLTVTWHEPCALGENGAPSTLSISSVADPLADLPCTWKGTSHGTTHHYDPIYDEVGSIDGTFTFGNPVRTGNLVTYEIVSGAATWQADGHLLVLQSDGQLASCPFSKGGTEKVVGLLHVFDDGSGHLTYNGGGGTDGQNLDIGCDPGATEIINTDMFFSTCLDNQIYTPGSLNMSGTCDSDYPGDFGYHDVFTWNLTGISCSAPAVSPQGVCGGPTSEGMPSRSSGLITN